MEPLESMVDMTAKLFECDRDEMYHYMLRLCSKYKKNADVYTQTVVFVKLYSWCEGQWMILIVCRLHLLSTLVIYPAVEKHCTSAVCVCVCVCDRAAVSEAHRHTLSLTALDCSHSMELSVANSFQQRDKMCVHYAHL